MQMGVERLTKAVEAPTIKSVAPAPEEVITTASLLVIVRAPACFGQQG